MRDARERALYFGGKAAGRDRGAVWIQAERLVESCDETRGQCHLLQDRRAEAGDWICRARALQRATWWRVEQLGEVSANGNR